MHSIGRVEPRVFPVVQSFEKFVTVAYGELLADFPQRIFNSLETGIMFLGSQFLVAVEVGLPSSKILSEVLDQTVPPSRGT